LLLWLSNIGLGRRLNRIVPFSAYHLIEKVNGIKYLYAWLDRHPDDQLTIPIFQIAKLRIRHLSGSEINHPIVFGSHDPEKLKQFVVTAHQYVL